MATLNDSPARRLQQAITDRQAQAAIIELAAEDYLDTRVLQGAQALE